MSNYAADISKYTPNVNDQAVKAIVNYCGIALQGRDSALASGSDRNAREARLSHSAG